MGVVRAHYLCAMWGGEEGITTRKSATTRVDPSPIATCQPPSAAAWILQRSASQRIFQTPATIPRAPPVIGPAPQWRAVLSM